MQWCDHDARVERRSCDDGGSASARDHTVNGGARGSRTPSLIARARTAAAAVGTAGSLKLTCHDAVARAGTSAALAST